MSSRCPSTTSCAAPRSRSNSRAGIADRAESFGRAGRNRRARASREVMRHQTTLRRMVFLRCGLGVAVLVALFAWSAAAVAAPGAAARATRSGTSRSAAGEAVDRRIARDAGLRRSDFPAGWRSSPGPAQTMGSACPALAAAKAAVSARANSRDFLLDDSATADSAVYVFPDTATSVRSFVQLTSHANTTCL